MKKFLAVLALAAFGALPVRADTMNFVTVLSSPVGTFNQVEEVDSQNAVTAPVINFCTGRGSGIVQLNGRGNPAAAKVNLERGAVLGGNAAEYRLPTLTMQAGGTLKGSRLLANTVNANNVPTLVKSSDIYASALNVQGAKTKKLNVGNGKSQITQAHEAEKMVWSNEHQQDKNGANSTLYAKQFLLKSEGTPAAADCSNDTYKRTHKSECCPGTPETDTACWTTTWEWGPKKTFTGNFTVNFSVDAPQSCYDAISTNPNVYRFVLPKEAVNPILNCGRLNNTDKPQIPAGAPTHTPTGLMSYSCYYEIGVPAALSSDSGTFHTGCKKLSSTDCECTSSRWPGHETVSKVVKNGW